jgi:UDP-N-acetylglucosamine 2-epimerase (non-hydrolysing)
MEKLFRGEWKKGSIPPLWDGHAAERIIGSLIEIFAVTKKYSRAI